MRSSAMAAMPKIITRVSRDRTYPSAPEKVASSGAAAKAAKSTRGTISNRVVNDGAGADWVSAISVMAAPSALYGKQPGGAEEQDGCHENVDQHRGDGASGLACGGGIEDEAQQVRREGAAD